MAKYCQMDPDCDLVIPLPLRPNPRWANSSTLQWWRLWPWHRSRGRSATNTCHFVPYAMRCFTSARWNNPKRFHKQNQYWVLLPWYNQHQPTLWGSHNMPKPYSRCITVSSVSMSDPWQPWPSTRHHPESRDHHDGLDLAVSLHGHHS